MPIIRKYPTKVSSNKVSVLKPPGIERQLRANDFPVYTKQNEALQMLDLVSIRNRRIFAFEFTTHKPGIRKFTIADLDYFCNWYLAPTTNPRYFHEILVEDLPNRLFLDCEFSKFYNKNVNAPEMINQVMDVVGALLEKMVGQPVPRSCFLVLDSSTEDKFSCHLIVHLPNDKLFPSTVRMKRTIDRIVKACEDAKIGIIDSGNPLAPEKCIVDNTIYTRNRNFRLYLSTKCGQDTPLTLADYCTFYAKRSSRPNDTEIFFDSLIIPKDFQNYGMVDVNDF